MSTSRDPMLDREKEIKAITQALAEASEGNGRVLLFEGTIGVGKSRLIKAAKAIAAAEGATVLSGRGAVVEQQFAFGIVRQLFESVLAADESEGSAELLVGPARLAQPLFTYQQPAAVSPAHHDALHATLHGLYWLCVNLSQQAPLVLLVDDAQLSDAPSLRFLHYLANRIEDHRILIVATAHPEDPHGNPTERQLLTVPPGARILQMAPLSAAAVHDLVTAAVAGQPDQRLAEECHRLTAGNPLLLRELLAEPEIASGAVEVGQLAQFAPAATSRRLSGLLDSQWAATGRLAQVAAVFGEGDLEAVAQVAGMAEDEAEAARRSLTAAGVLEAGARVRFTCPLLRNVAYAQLTSAQRRQWHLATARLLAARGARSGVVARHLLHLDAASDPWVADALLNAADEAVRTGAMADAVAFLRQALGGNVPDRLSVARLSELAYAERCMRDPQAVEHLRTAYRLARGSADRPDIGLDLSAALVAAGRDREALGLLEDLLDEVGEQDQPSRVSAEFATVAGLHLSTWHKLHRVMTADPLPEAASEPARALHMQSVLHVLAHGAPAEDGVLAARQVLASGERLGPRDTEFPAGGVAAWVLVLCDQLQDAERAAAEIIREGRRRGMLLATYSGLTVRAVALLGQGRLPEAEEQARAALSGVGRGKLVGGTVPLAVATVAAAALHRGDPDGADKVLHDTGFVGQVPGGVLFAPLLGVRGRLRQVQGRLGEALADFRLSRRQGRGLTRCPPFTTWPDEAMVLTRMDRHDRAQRLCRRELAHAHAFGSPTSVAVALRTKALVEGGSGALGQLQQSAALLAQSAAALESATTLVELGAALRRTGQRSLARQQLKNGLELADNSGAVALSERALSELTAAGARRSMNRLSGEALTPSEYRVASMAANGLRNQDIARHLFVTVKTVEWHLSQVYRKLGITSRRALEIALGDTDAEAPGSRRNAS